MPSAAVLVEKQKYEKRVHSLLQEYNKAFLVCADNVASRQFMDIRAALRGRASILMGKNTLMKRCVRKYCERSGNDDWRPLLDLLVGNVGVCFVKDDLIDVRDAIAEFKVGAPAKMGMIAQCDVTIPAGPTGLDPAQTSFFQALAIPTKIVKGTIEITTDFKVCTEGEKVSASEATLLSKLGIRPFAYGLQIMQVFEDGAMYAPAVLDITDADLIAKFQAGLSNVAAVSLATNYPTLASVPHSFVNGYKKVLAVSVATDYTFPLAEKIKAILSDPEAFAAMMAAASAAAAPSGGGGGGGAAAAAPEPEPEPEEEEEMEFDLFD